MLHRNRRGDELENIINHYHHHIIMSKTFQLAFIFFLFVFFKTCFPLNNASSSLYEDVHGGNDKPLLYLRGQTGTTFSHYSWSTWEMGLSFPRSSNPAKPIKLIVDIGLELGSGLTCFLTNNPDLFLLTLEAHPVNFGGAYLNTLHMLREANATNTVTPHVVVLPVGAANHTGMVEFYDSFGSACGSLLKSTDKAWFCAQTTETRVVPVVRLESLLKRVPPSYHFYYLKSDTEGADHLVLAGAGSYISKFEMVSIECRPANDSNGDLSRVGFCLQSNVITWMRERGFNYSSCTSSDCHFARLSEGDLETAKVLANHAALSLFNGVTDCSGRQWDYQWDHPRVAPNSKPIVNGISTRDTTAVTQWGGRRRLSVAGAGAGAGADGSLTKR
jgi:FkbM family methyltransferase